MEDMLMKKTTQEIPLCTDPEHWSVLEQIAREGARQMLKQALENEVNEYLEAHKDLKVDDRTLIDYRDTRRFSSKILPRYVRRIPSIDNLIPVNDFPAALSAVQGEGVKGYSRRVYRLPRNFSGHEVFSFEGFFQGGKSFEEFFRRGKFEEMKGIGIYHIRREISLFDIIQGIG